VHEGLCRGRVGKISSMFKRLIRARSRRHHSREYRRLQLEQLETRTVLSGLPLGALPTDTAEYMLGDVRVSLVLMESTGSESSEDWTSSDIDAVKIKVRESLDWWEDLLAAQSSVHSVRFHLDFQYADNPVPTDVEPIARVSNDYPLWVSDFLAHAEADGTSDISTAMRLFNNSQRQLNGDDWGFTIFIVNDEQDADGMFAAGGSFRRAFAFAGGRYFVAPASRPTASLTHETGHIFWAKDEYSGAGTYLDRRGYYNTQNLNASDNPAAGFEQSDSIMASGVLMSAAFQDQTSSASSLEMIGWKDSDQDGVFDVLDLPLLLTGSGSRDPVSGTYRFVGEARVQALPNLNTSGLQSDVTTSTVDFIEYRLDGGSWQVIATPSEPVVMLDLSFDLPEVDQELELRARSVDAGTGQTVSTSASLVGNTLARSVTQLSGIAGYSYADLNQDGSWDPGEPAVADTTLRIVDGADQAELLWTIVEPDNFNDQQVLNTATSGVSLRALGGGLNSESVYSRISSQSSTPSRVLANDNAAVSAIRTSWNDSSRRLRMDFDSPQTAVRLDAIGNGGSDYGQLEIYDSQANLLGRYTTEALAWGEVETMLLSRSQADIDYAIAGAHADTEVHLDNLRFGPAAETLTDTAGAFWLAELAAGTYRLEVVPPAGWSVSAAASGIQTITIGSSLPVAAAFGLSAPAWHNPHGRHDVNNDGSTVPLDALLLINDLNDEGPRALDPPQTGDQPPPYLDVNADGSITSIDALQVITELNRAIEVGQASQPVDLPLYSLAVAAEGESAEDPGQPLEALEHAFAAIPAAAKDEAAGVDLPRLGGSRSVGLARISVKRTLSAAEDKLLWEMICHELEVESADLLAAEMLLAAP